MEQAQFWQVIERSRKEAANGQAAQTAALAAVLRTLAPAEIADFNRHFSDYLDLAYRWDLWGAAFIIGEGCADDDFLDFRSWLISMGEVVYQEALANPESLARFADDESIEDFFFEDFQYTAAEVYQEITGESMPLYLRELSSEPEGEEWDSESDELKHRLPKLWKSFNE